MDNIQELTVARTIRLAPEVDRAIEAEAQALSRETADYMAEILARYALPALGGEAVARLNAEMRIKAAAAEISRALAARDGVTRDHTLRVFRAIRKDEKLRADYLLAANCATGFEKAVPEKHQLNLYLGAISKRAAGAETLMINGKRDLIRNIQGEFCSSVTALAGASN